MKKVGAGSFGQIYFGQDLIEKIKVAIKLEITRSKYPQLPYENKIYEVLSPHEGIPKIHWFGMEGEFHCMVMEALGPSLEDMF